MISHGYCFLGSSFLDAFSITLKEFSRLHYCSIIKVLCCCSRDSFVILAHSVGFCQQFFIFLKLFSTSAAPMSLTTVCGFLLFLLLFPVASGDFAILPELSSFGKSFFTFLLFFYSYILFFCFLLKKCHKKEGLKYTCKMILKTSLYIFQ